MRIIKTFVVLVLFGFSNLAAATDGIMCTGKIDIAGIHGTDRVFVKLSGMNASVNFCNLGQTIGTTVPISPQQCKAVYSTLLLAYAMDKSVVIWFDNVVIGTNCTNFSGGEVATARYVELNR